MRAPRSFARGKKGNKLIEHICGSHGPIVWIELNIAADHGWLQKIERDTGQKRMRQLGKDNTLRLRREAELVIRQSGRPVPIDELYRQLIERGVDVDGARRLGAKLAHAPHLVFIRRRGWWLKRVPLSEGRTPF
jgi:hypothetical protein